MIETRAETAAASFEAVRKSLLELLAYADGTGVCLGIENRYHYNENSPARMNWKNCSPWQVRTGLASSTMSVMQKLWLGWDFIRTRNG